MAVPHLTNENQLVFSSSSPVYMQQKYEGVRLKRSRLYFNWSTTFRSSGLTKVTPPLNFLNLSSISVT